MMALPRKTLHLVIEGTSESARDLVPAPSDETEVFVLTQSNAAEALKKIFAADAVAIWSDVNL